MRITEGERCAVLDDEARRCPRLAIEADYFHGDGELSYPKVSWVRAAVCAKHAEMSPFSLGKTKKRQFSGPEEK